MTVVSQEGFGPHDSDPGANARATTTTADKQDAEQRIPLVGPVVPHDDEVLTAAPVTSRQVSWWSVHEFVTPLLDRAGSCPVVGTPSWCALDDDDPRKLAALLDAAQHWALRLETGQEALGDASRQIAGALDWSALAARYRTHAEFYAARPWLRRQVVS